MTTYTYTESTIPNQISTESGDPNQAIPNQEIRIKTIPNQEIQIKSIPNHGVKLTANNIESWCQLSGEIGLYSSYIDIFDWFEDVILQGTLLKFTRFA